MLYVFFGNDTIATRKAAYRAVETLAKTGEVFWISGEQYIDLSYEDIASATPLFGESHTYVLDTPSHVAEAKETLLENAALLGESPNHFILIESPLSSHEKQTLKKNAAQIEEATQKDAGRFNIFSLTDALLRKDKKSLWLLLEAARKNGATDEEIIGTLFWQAKILALAAKTRSAEEAEQKPFVYAKAHRALKQFSEVEVRQMATALLRIYHEGHLGRTNTTEALERWVLSL